MEEESQLVAVGPKRVGERGKDKPGTNRGSSWWTPKVESGEGECAFFLRSLAKDKATNQLREGGGQIPHRVFALLARKRLRGPGEWETITEHCPFRRDIKDLTEENVEDVRDKMQKYLTESLSVTIGGKGNNALE
eukprot:g15691.t1